MLPNDIIVIKNEPVKNEDFLSEELLSEDIEFKIQVENSNKFIAADVIASSSTKAIICTESEYLAEGHNAFESIIVKEEERLNNCDEESIRKRNGRRKLEYKEHEKAFECYVCKFAAKDTVELRRHLKVHAGKTQLACDVCNRIFVRESADSTLKALKEHQRIHTGEKLFACDKCDKKFVFKSYLKKHEIIHNTDKLFACDQCHRKYTRK